MRGHSGPRKTIHPDIRMTNSTQPGHDSKVRSSGAVYADLQRKIEWNERAGRSEATVWTESSGHVSLIVEETVRYWRWDAYGWLGVRLGGGEAGTRAAAKRQAVYWWGSLTIADRLDDEREKRNLLRRRGIAE